MEQKNWKNFTNPQPVILTVILSAAKNLVLNILFRICFGFRASYFEFSNAPSSGLLFIRFPHKVKLNGITYSAQVQPLAYLVTRLGDIIGGILAKNKEFFIARRSTTLEFSILVLG